MENAMMEHTLKVEALANGTVIDHIPAGRGSAHSQTVSHVGKRRAHLYRL